MSETDNVFPLKTRPQSVHEDVVEMFEKYLERAKNGDFVGAAVCYVRPNMAVGTGWTECDYAGALMGAGALLAHRLVKATDEG